MTLSKAAMTNALSPNRLVIPPATWILVLLTAQWAQGLMQVRSGYDSASRSSLVSSGMMERPFTFRRIQQEGSAITTRSPRRGSNSALLGIRTGFIASATSRVVQTVAFPVGAVTLAGTAFVKFVLDKPSRPYGNNTVAREYDAWASDGILEYYWGEHIHLGYYSPEDRKAGYFKLKSFKEAKYDFIDEMMKFGEIDPASLYNAKVLDVGCGFGGTSRYLAKNLGPGSHVTGITLSPNQVARATKLAKEQGIADRTHFTVMDALHMTFPDNTFDIVWACESGEHMPDKRQYIQQMMRVLKPGGKFVMACWSQRDDRDEPFDKRDLRDLQYLYEEWTHPFFISIRAFKELIEDTGMMGSVKTANWVDATIASWRLMILEGLRDPRGWIFKPRLYYKCVRDAYCLERMHRAFKRGLMEYGMWAATKLPADEPLELQQ